MAQEVLDLVLGSLRTEFGDPDVFAAHAVRVGNVLLEVFDVGGFVVPKGLYELVEGLSEDWGGMGR
jgi:hypothetical protein